MENRCLRPRSWPRRWQDRRSPRSVPRRVPEARFRRRRTVDTREVMKLEGEQTLLRVYLRNTDKQGWFSPPAAEALVQRARRDNLAGATVLRGIYGLDITGKVLEGSAVWSL